MNRGAFVAGLVFTVVGVVFLLERLDVLDVGGAYLWPILLIVIGALILLTARGRGPDRSEPS